MTEFGEAPFSANFNLYGTDGLRVQFTVRSNSDPTSHVALVRSYLQAAAADGYSVNLPGLEAGEETEEVDGWVLGETSKGDLCVFLYSVHHGLKWRIGTVYEERLGELPFSIAGAKKWPGGAPEREPAERQGYMNTVEPFKIVMEETGEVTSTGKPVKRFARVFDAAPAADNEPPPTGNETSWQAQQEREHMRPTRNGNLTPPMPTEAMKKKFHALGVEVYGDEWDDKRLALTKHISGKREGGPVVTSSNDLYRVEMQVLIDGMEAKQKESAAA